MTSLVIGLGLTLATRTPTSTIASTAIGTSDEECHSHPHAQPPGRTTERCVWCAAVKVLSFVSHHMKRHCTPRRFATVAALLVATCALSGCIARRDMSKHSPYNEFVGRNSAVERPVGLWRHKGERRPALAPFEAIHDCGYCSHNQWEQIGQLERGSVVRILSATYLLARGPGSVSEVLGVAQTDVPGVGLTRFQFLWRIGDSSARVPWQGGG